MIISITHKDILEGRIALGKWNAEFRHYENGPEFPYRETHCPIALASRRAGFINAHVAFNLYSENYEPVKLPIEAIEFINKLSRGLPVYPFEFEIEENQLIRK
jgi:hypothetical protein